MNEKIIFEEKDNGAWIPARYNPGRWMAGVRVTGTIVGGDLLLTEENLIFKGRKTGQLSGKKYDIIIPLKNASFTLKKPDFWSPPPFTSLYVESVNGEFLAQFKSKKLEEWKMAIENQIIKTDDGPISSSMPKANVVGEIVAEQMRSNFWELAPEEWKELEKIDKDAEVNDYCEKGIWDIAGLRDDLKLMREKLGEKIKPSGKNDEQESEVGTILSTGDNDPSKKSDNSGVKSKLEVLRELKALLDEKIIDDEEFKKMKKEIIN
jgi:hypothetical protein